MASQHTQGCRHCYQAPAHTIPPIQALSRFLLSHVTMVSCVHQSRQGGFSVVIPGPGQSFGITNTSHFSRCTHEPKKKSILFVLFATLFTKIPCVTLDKVLNLPQFPLLENGETNRVVRLSELYT